MKALQAVLDNRDALAPLGAYAILVFVLFALAF
jgi:hypothetical protein